MEILEIHQKQLINIDSHDWSTLAEFHEVSAENCSDPMLRGYKLRSEKLAKAFALIAEVYADDEQERM